ncbi:MAG TPA: hypothetical protein VEC99_15670 [Clostridia bacterium]|nr:hypothetical protein [Clostridia bacterium]
MNKLVIGGICLVVLALGASYIMMWPPLCFYAGESGESCINKLRQIHGAKQQLALDSGRTNGPVNTSELVKLYFEGRPLVCPSGGTYTYGNLDEEPVCSLATNAAPPAVKARVGLLGWRWKVWPSPGPGAHKLP